MPNTEVIEVSEKSILDKSMLKELKKMERVGAVAID